MASRRFQRGDAISYPVNHTDRVTLDKFPHRVNNLECGWSRLFAAPMQVTASGCIPPWMRRILVVKTRKGKTMKSKLHQLAAAAHRGVHTTQREAP